MELIHQIVARDGSLIYQGAPGQVLMGKFAQRCKARGGRAEWGHHYRVMKRRSDAPNVVFVCRATGERLLTNLEPTNATRP